MQRSEQQMSDYREVDAGSLPHRRLLLLIQITIVAGWMVVFWRALTGDHSWIWPLAASSLLLVALMLTLTVTRRCGTCGGGFVHYENQDKTTAAVSHYFVACPKCRYFYRATFSPD